VYANCLGGCTGDNEATIMWIRHCLQLHYSVSANDDRDSLVQRMSEMDHDGVGVTFNA